MIMPIHPDDARSALHDAVSAVLNEAVPPLRDEMSMFEDLRMDSTTMLETLMELQDSLDFEVDPEELDLEDFLTVGAYIQFIVSRKEHKSVLGGQV
jgi:acyl carrier protein